MKSREQKQTEGAARTEYWQALSPAEQLSELDLRLGKGIGAKRQREKLQQKLAKEA